MLLRGPSRAVLIFILFWFEPCSVQFGLRVVLFAFRTWRFAWRERCRQYMNGASDLILLMDAGRSERSVFGTLFWADVQYSSPIISCVYCSLQIAAVRVLCMLVGLRGHMQHAMNRSTSDLVLLMSWTLLVGVHVQTSDGTSSPCAVCAPYFHSCVSAFW
jgi:hypothetical protein